MAWWIAFAVVGFAGFLFDGQLAHHMPFSDLTIRQTMIGTLIGLAAGYTIHIYHRAR
jgi:hypothetical protein